MKLCLFYRSPDKVLQPDNTLGILHDGVTLKDSEPYPYFF